MVTVGIGCFWAGAGSGQAGITGLALVFAGETIRLVMRAGAPPGEVPVRAPALPFLLVGLLAHESMARLFGIRLDPPWQTGLRTAAAVYALLLLWDVLPGGPRDVWGRILGIQAGAAQALYLGIPAAWLLRPMRMVAGNPSLEAGVALLAGALWLVAALRLLRRRRDPVSSQLFSLLLVLGGSVVLGWLNVQIRSVGPSLLEPPQRWLLASGIVLILGALGAETFWIRLAHLIPSRRPG
jgi:hypothetical protein